MAGRPRAFDRDDALRKARDAFWARGYEGTSMADLVAVMGVASASIYAAFESKEALFREAIVEYEGNEGAFADVAFAEEPTARRAIERMLREAIEIYTRRGRPRGCMVVLSATNTSEANGAVTEWLASHRRARAASITARLERGRREGELAATANVQALGDFIAVVFHGISIQARDGVPRKALLAVLPVVMGAMDAAT